MGLVIEIGIINTFLKCKLVKILNNYFKFSMVIFFIYYVLSIDIIQIISLQVSCLNIYINLTHNNEH